MLQKIIAVLLRWYYRFINWRAWKGHVQTGEYSDLHLASSGTGLALRLFANMIRANP
ncbi:MAG: hypothetical protein O7F73_02280 [Gammaproteobacteria bacterium]|nr:hypothetical protein [Gammaproteobacteria bacterium]